MLLNGAVQDLVSETRLLMFKSVCIIYWLCLCLKVLIYAAWRTPLLEVAVENEKEWPQIKCLKGFCFYRNHLQKGKTLVYSIYHFFKNKSQFVYLGPGFRATLFM